MISGAQDEAVDWEGVWPVLDEAINELDERDRQAILLRYFANRPFGEVGQRLRLSENAARMRVERALGKLHERLARRGITSTSAALAAALSGQAVVAAPAGVAVASTSAAMAAAGGLAGAWFAFMSTAKLPMALTAALLAAGGAIVAVQSDSSRRAASEMADLARQDEAISSLRSSNDLLAAAAAQVRGLQDEDSRVGILQAQLNALQAKAATGSAKSPAVPRRAPARTMAPGADSAVYDVARLDQLPKLTAQNRPVYPPELSNAGASGQVVVDFVVGPDGLVYNAHALSSTDKAFEDSAVQAVSQWGFAPGQVGGQNVSTHMQVPIVFTLSGAPPPPTADTWF
jgi:TonB family protein